MNDDEKIDVTSIEGEAAVLWIVEQFVKIKRNSFVLNVALPDGQEAEIEIRLINLK